MVYLISLGVSIHGRPRASIAAIFRQSAGYVNDNFLGCVPLRFLNLCSTFYFFWFVLSYLQDLFALHSGGLLFSIFNLIVFSKSLAVSNSSNYLFGATWIIFLIFYFDHSKTSVPLQRIIGLFQSFDLQNL